MTLERFRIGVVAPGTRASVDVLGRAQAIAAELYPDRVELVVHPQCFLSAGHFAGDDETRANALVEVANDPEIDVIWFARGGYGACRIAEDVIPGLRALSPAVPSPRPRPA